MLWDIPFPKDHITVNKNGKKTPVVLIHGFLSALGLWIHNIDQLARDRTVYAIDVLGFGSSGRPTFSNDALEAERQMIKSIEAWVTMVLGSRHFVLVPHGKGGFLVSAYFLQHPERVAHLILADWLFNSMAVLRLSDGLGQFLSRQGGWYLAQKFTGAVEDAYETITQYLYYCNSQSPTGETFFHHTIMGRSNYQCAKYPMVNRLSALEPDIPISFIYGASSWIVREPGRIVNERRIVSTVNLHVITGAGHHVYRDTKEKFNDPAVPQS
ncbi:hypothetical protein DAPPUDRAFT_318953 [Daphnia pulex]|uniref:AB hydrolase-1 domain-containing protein n=1 Tax=Daphnia pulex TaxID=6669 RepID=E9GK84_DAPPU|nr:hypothetical protein DAPPUDRAFT_318953 [Daphnia pulex]|eukprot:EFX80105.1 hypothetical protein DAPPUDRAFT_318953 [Daphnia pulex]